jgi:hypothetical protein
LSEGSFGPSIGLFVHADDEFFTIYGQKKQLEIIVREMSMETNFSGKRLLVKQELTEFVDKVNFPCAYP